MTEMKNNESKPTSETENNNADYIQLYTQCQEQNSELKNQLLRTAADFENFKKRVDRERISWILQTQKSFLLPILSIIDDFERALTTEFAQSKLPAGIELIYKELLKLLEKYEVMPITQLETFDPELHEAILHVESEKHKTGDIAQLLQKGYTFKGELLRPAKVSVAK